MFSSLSLSSRSLVHFFPELLLILGLYLKLKRVETYIQGEALPPVMAAFYVKNFLCNWSLGGDETNMEYFKEQVNKIINFVNEVLIDRFI